LKTRALSMSTILHTHTVAEKKEVMAMAVLILRKLQRASDRGFLLLQVFPLYLG
jgi:hypothetical protein